MNRLNRHDQVLISRRRRNRKRANRPKPVRRAAQGLSAVLLTTLLFFGLFSGLGVAAAVGVYSSYADLVQDASEFTTQQEEFQTVRVYDSTGTQLLYESVDPRPTGGDRTYVKLNEVSFWASDCGHCGRGSQLLHESRHQHTRLDARLCPEFTGRRRAGRLVDYAAADQERDHPGGGAHAAQLRPQNQRGRAGAGDDAPLRQRPNSGVVSQQQLLRQPRLRHRGREPGLF